MWPRYRRIEHEKDRIDPGPEEKQAMQRFTELSLSPLKPLADRRGFPEDFSSGGEINLSNMTLEQLMELREQETQRGGQ